MTGMNGRGGRSVSEIVDRELAAGNKVVIHGHPHPNAATDMIGLWTMFMDEYARIAAGSGKVFFIDTREDPDLPPTATVVDPKWYSGDDSRPSPLAGTKFGEAIAALIHEEEK